MTLFQEKFKRVWKKEEEKRSWNKEIKGQYFRNVLWLKKFRRKSW